MTEASEINRIFSLLLRGARLSLFGAFGGFSRRREVLCIVLAVYYVVIS